MLRLFWLVVCTGVGGLACGRSVLEVGDVAAMAAEPPGGAGAFGGAGGRGAGGPVQGGRRADTSRPAGGMAARAPARARDAGAVRFEPPDAGRAEGDDAGEVERRPASFRTTGDCIEGFIRSSVEGLSYDGRYFAFVDADGLARVLDRQSGELAAATLPSDESLDVVAMSGNAALVAFKGMPGNQGGLFVWARTQDEVTAGYFLGDGTRGAISFDGRYLTFTSRADDLTLPAVHPLGGIVVVDRTADATWQASVSSEGEAANDYSMGPDLSDDGSLTVFASTADNLVAGKPARRWDAYLHEHGSGRTTLAAPSLAGGYPDAYVQRVRVAGNGTTIAFDSLAADVVAADVPDTHDLFLRDVASGEVRSPTLGRIRARTLELANLSRDGSVVLFSTDGDGLVEGDDNGVTDVFTYDRAIDGFALVAQGRDGAPLRDESSAVALSGDGRVAAFQTRAAELTDGAAVVTCFAER